VMMPLYFPEDKTEYIIPGIVCVLFIIGAIATWRMFIRISKREAERLQKVEEKLLAEKKQ
ncbi:TPA: hypothetical protein QCN67_005741, partial [Bacillus thuringiensis]|nr:hypothetical protein [Bacillus thuringiensis]HDR6517922.1 hypothetical protein [Bacillus thuringiensis]